VTTAQIDVLVTKHGFAEALQSVNAAFETLHAYFLDRLGAAANAGEMARHGRLRTAAWRRSRRTTPATSR
jgi:hypothetical protein